MFVHMDGLSLIHLMTEPTKRAILTRLLQGGATVSDLVAHTKVEQSNVSHQLRKLKEQGIVRSRPLGRSRRYSIADPHLALLLAELGQVGARLGNITEATRAGHPYQPPTPQGITQ